jgi:predicted porin
MVVKRRVGLLLSSALVGAAFLTAAPAFAADMDAMVTKAPMVAVAPAPPASCGSVYDFLFTACPLTWYGVTFYGTVDMGGTYQTHGTPFDPNFPTGASYLIGAGGTGATGRTAGFGLGPNALSQSNVGVKIIEPIAPGGWSFIAQYELGFDPYSLLLANAPQAMQNAIGTAQNAEAIPADSSRWGWLNNNQYFGFSQPVYGTLTFGRQNTLFNDGIGAYDPMGGAYAFSPIGFSGKAGGAGDTEDARWTTAIKYRVNIGDVHLGVMGQPLSSGYDAYNPNNGAVAGDIGGAIQHFGPGTLSLDFIGTWEKDAVNIAPSYLGQATVNGYPTTFPATAYLKATISNNTAFMALAKYSFGSWGNTPPPVVGKAAPAPSGPSGIPLTLYAGYEWIQYSNPSDLQSSFPDDGFLFVDPTGLTGGHGAAPTANGTAINNNAFNSLCGTGTAFGGCSDETFQIMWAGAKYGITRDLDIIGAYYHYIQNQYAAGGAVTCPVNSLHSQCAGTFDVYSAVLDWRFLPKWDTYIGIMYSAAYGGISNGDISTNNLATTAGVRFRF